MFRHALMDSAAWWRAPEYLLDGVPPAAVLDFGRRRYALPSLSSSAVASADVSSLVQLRGVSEDEVFAQYTASATTTRTRVNEAGVLVADLSANQPRWSLDGIRMRLMLNNAATNLLLNSASLSTQSVSVTAQAYTLSFYGTGTVTLSDASTAGPLVGTGASNRVTLTFTPSAGTLTLTVSGTVSNAQLETGSFATPYIPTAGSTATRLIETFRLPAVVEALAQRTAATVLVQGYGLSRPLGRILGGAGSDALMMHASSISVRANKTANLNAVFGSGSFAAGYGTILAFDDTGRSLCANGGTVASDSNGVGDRSTVYLGRDGSNTAYGDGHYDQMVIWPVRAADASLPGKAVVYA